ncbi:MAG: HEAT repeat domain-containing protein [Pseudomonadota bacterium]
MNNFRKGAISLLFGLTVSQVFFFFFVYQSNRTFYRRLLAVADAGYLVIPGERIMATLPDFLPAFYGALFFTFTLGISLSLFTLFMINRFQVSGFKLGCWRQQGAWSRRIFVALCLVWIGSAVILAFDGINPIITAWFLLVPVMITVGDRHGMMEYPGGKAWNTPDVWVVMAGAVFLFGQCLVQNPSSLLIDIRDKVLLSTETGRAINDFYYRYTLYAAEAIKSPHQKQIKTCRIDTELHAPLHDRLATVLAANDYLAVPVGVPTDLAVRPWEGGLTLSDGNRARMEISMDRLLSDTGGVLKAYSTRSDRNGLLRKYTAVGLLVSLLSVPVFLLYGAVLGLRAVFKRPSLASPLAAVVCMVCAVLFPVLQGLHYAGDKFSESELSQLLESERESERISGLKALVRQEGDITRYPKYRFPENPADMVERYWALKALGRCKNAEAYQVVLKFKDDPHPNIQCIFLEALGRLGSKKDRGAILEKIKAAPNWYVQWYAYQALKDLGWRQQKST